MEGVTVVICCFNSAGRIRKALECFQSQKFASAPVPWELIVVDNCSTDNTREVIKSIWDENPVTALRILEEKKQGQTYARKTGLDHALYDYVSFVDDDNHVDSNWINNVYIALKVHPDCAACNGISFASFEGEEPWWFRYFDINFAVGRQGDESGYVPVKRAFLFGAGLTVRKSCLLELYEKNYPAIQTGRLVKNLRGGGEDSEMCFCFIIMGYRLYYDEKIKFHHFMPASRMTLDGLRRIQISLGRDRVVQSIYRSVLNPREKAKSTWWLEFLAYLKAYFLFIVSNISFSGEKGFLFRIRMIYHHAYLFELIHLRNKYAQYRKRINSFADVCQFSPDHLKDIS